MILISFTLALIAIVFGAKLLAQSQKENLGALYKYLAWFVIIAGFSVMLCDGLHAIMRCCHRGDRMMNQSMMMGRGDGMGMMGNGRMWMMHHKRGMMNCGTNNCCGGMMNCGGNMNCCDGMMGGGNCSDGMMNCGGNSKCADGMMSCPDGKGMSSGSCPMMGSMKDKSDSTKAKAEK